MPSPSLSAFDAAAILIVLAAALGYVNHRFLRLPSSVGLTVTGAVASLLVVGIDQILPASRLSPRVVSFLGEIDFQGTLMKGMLSFLLFAGALHVDWTEMRRGRWPILVLSTIGVLLSTTIVAFGFFGLTRLIGLHVPLLWCFIFGALISPTDPVAVMGVLKRASVPPTLQATVAGESLRSPRPSRCPLLGCDEPKRSYRRPAPERAWVGTDTMSFPRATTGGGTA